MAEAVNPAFWFVNMFSKLWIKGVAESIDDGVDPFPDPNIPVVGQAHDPVTGSGLELA